MKNVDENKKISYIFIFVCWILTLKFCYIICILKNIGTIIRNSLINFQLGREATISWYFSSYKVIKYVCPQSGRIYYILFFDHLYRWNSCRHFFLLAQLPKGKNFLRCMVRGGGDFQSWKSFYSFLSLFMHNTF